MAREKRITLFNKNHISLIKVTNLKNNSEYVSYNEIENRSVFSCKEYYHKTKEVTIKCESPLGFYYYKKQTEKGYNPNIYDVSQEFHTLKVILKNENYVLTYMTKNGEYSVNAEVRPWEICKEEKALSDRMIKILETEIKSLFEIIKTNKLKISSYKKYSWENDNPTMSYDKLKNKVFEELFGNKNGIRIQTNDEKILSHGFDLKTSFRKM